VSALRVAVLLSGTGRTLDYLLEEQRAGGLPVEIVGVISSRPDVRGVARAREEGLKTTVLRRPGHADARAYGEAIGRALRGLSAQVAAMAGFLKLWSIPADFAGRVLNIHPALLPAFGGPGMHGSHVHEAVLASGAKVSGCTVHFADDRYDSGPIILQRTCEVRFEDTPETLAARVFSEERIAYPQALRLLAEGRLEIVGRRVGVRP
jgi:formyltetrahydrofolate-dependent phosphoribosylglycinamide formyltransferase